MAWHMGYPLLQSLFTSHHIDRLLSSDPKTLEDARFDQSKKAGQMSARLQSVLRAYCLAVIKTCDFVHRRICSEHYYEVSTS